MSKQQKASKVTLENARLENSKFNIETCSAIYIHAPVLACTGTHEMFAFVLFGYCLEITDYQNYIRNVLPKAMTRIFEYFNFAAPELVFKIISKLNTH